MKKVLANIFWVLLAIAGAVAYVTLALRRGEQLSSAYILNRRRVQLCHWLPLYSKWIAARVADARMTVARPPAKSMMTARTSSRPTNGSFSGITSPPSPVPDRWSARF